ncbi:MAG: ABC transporter substrate-binding protein [Alphaproteobacteria bacterium]|nr:ABC transporter substrate-binding protein [Alphaproteobacteria bacterium]
MIRIAAIAAAALLAAAPAHAQQRILTIAAITPPSQLDPHFHSSGQNNQAMEQIFDPLLLVGPDGTVEPRLASAWRVIDDHTWEFTLRPNIRFHDGTPFTPDDIAFTYARIPNVPNSPGGFAPYVREIAGIDVINPTTVRIRTAQPNPYLPYDVARLMILSKRIHEGAATADYTSGRVAIGTGAYRFASYTRDQRLELTRNEEFWGPKEPWERVVTRYIGNAGARVAALIAGEVDVIDGVPVQDVARLEATPNIAVFGALSHATAYLFPDSARDQAPFITDREGRPLDRNPLKDARVRRALAMAINRPAIVDRLLLGQGAPAEQLSAPSVEDRSRNARPIPFDPEGARRLLAEAGYPNGFSMTIHGPRGFFAGDDATLQAVAQNFARIGVETKVEVNIPSVHFSRATNRDFAMFLSTYAAPLAANALRLVVLTRDRAGAGSFNRQHYSNPTLDRLTVEGLRTMDTPRRNALIGQAVDVLMEDMGVIPLFYVRYNWAGIKNRVVVIPSPIGRTHAILVKPAGG